MNYIIEPNLEHRTLVEVVISLWNCSNVRSEIDEYFALLRRRQFYENKLDYMFHEFEWLSIEDIVIKNVKHLVLPELLKKKIVYLIKPVGLQILQWMDCYRYCYLEVIMPNKLCWKQQGTVDKKRTAEVLINDDSVDVLIRYQLACMNCLKDDILQLWNKLPENWRETMCNSGSPIMHQELILFWTYNIKGELSGIPEVLYDPHSPYQFAFELVALDGNIVATEYFLKMLTDEEKEESLVKTATTVARESCERKVERYSFANIRKKGFAEVLCFLLSQMDENKQLQVFKNSPYNVLTCLLDWPCQDFFMEAASRMWEFMPNRCFCVLLGKILNDQGRNRKDCCYKLFGEFWLKSLSTHRRYVVRECETSGYLLSILFKVEDKENIRLILKEATDEEKERIVFHNEGMSICECLMYKDKWDLLTFFLEQCISSTNMRIKFKKKFEERMPNCPEILQKKPNMFKKLCCILDDLIHNDDKKKRMEEGETSSTKKFCSAQ